MHINRYRPYQGILPYVGAGLSGVVIYCAVLHMIFVLAWVCLVPLFYFLGGLKARQAAGLGLTTGLALSACAFYWMIPGAERFTGSSAWYGVGVFLLCTALFSGYWALITLLMGQLKRSALVAASLFTCAEAALEALTKGMPWFQFHFANGLAQNLYAIQWTSYVGIYGLSFVVVWVNYAIAAAIKQKSWNRLTYPAIGILMFIATGWGILERYEGKMSSPKEKFSLSILSENIPTSLQWDSLSGDSLVGRLLYLAGQASQTKPNIELWSESAIPWTYSPDDDLVKEIDSLASQGESTQVLGMNTAYGQGEVYNSAYCIEPGGTVMGRYDKQVLLAAIEARWSGWLIPFFSSNGYSVHQAETTSPLKTPYGLAGIMICNESTLASAARDQVLKGANFLLNLSNDGWFSDTYLVPLHFYNVRLRAVETRRDIAVNSNNGISGMIEASGRIKEMRRDEAPFILNVEIRKNRGFTLASTYPNLMIWLCGAILLWSIASILYTLKKHSL